MNFRIPITRNSCVIIVVVIIIIIDQVKGIPTPEDMRKRCEVPGITTVARAHQSSLGRITPEMQLPVPTGYEGLC